MSDQGQKIVFLAQELLKTGVPDHADYKKPPSITMTFKTLCLTALAADGSLVTSLMHEEDRRLNRYEKMEIDALLFYVSKMKGIDEENLRHDVEKQTGIISLDDLTANQFPAIRLYLQEKAQ